MRHYTIHKAPGVPLQYLHCEILQKDWNDRIEYGMIPTRLGGGARDHVMPVQTWYNHIKAGDISVHYGETPYHPGKERKKGPKPHPAKTVLGRPQLDERPVGAKKRSELGHLEMDTVVSSTNGSGGQLVLLDRCSRRYYIEKINEISQRAIVRALKRLKKRHEWR